MSESNLSGTMTRLNILTRTKTENEEEDEVTGKEQAKQGPVLIVPCAASQSRRIFSTCRKDCYLWTVRTVPLPRPRVPVSTLPCLRSHTAGWQRGAWGLGSNTVMLSTMGVEAWIHVLPASARELGTCTVSILESNLIMSEAAWVCLHGKLRDNATRASENRHEVGVNVLYPLKSRIFAASSLIQ